ncbi:hypothetical protein [Pandoraea faecigallinarum]|uniref:hypothetical protein n=1 Tax=Pandoraea faecigallinarum TaxID=656179 RepID=UPI0012F520AD|nr:hypothetical protein [Pandoraea faecigallinarum]
MMFSQPWRRNRYEGQSHCPEGQFAYECLPIATPATVASTFAMDRRSDLKAVRTIPCQRIFADLVEGAIRYAEFDFFFYDQRMANLRDTMFIEAPNRN